MTAEERAAEITRGWGAMRVERRTLLEMTGSDSSHVAVENGGEWARALIAEAIRAAVAEERERCAKIAEAKAVFHRDNCHKSCACADGWHIAMAIRATGTGAADADIGGEG